jgi:hypothetical protein
MEGTFDVVENENVLLLVDRYSGCVLLNKILDVGLPANKQNQTASRQSSTPLYPDPRYPDPRMQTIITARLQRLKPSRQPPSISVFPLASFTTMMTLVRMQKHSNQETQQQSMEKQT